MSVRRSGSAGTCGVPQFDLDKIAAFRREKPCSCPSCTSAFNGADNDAVFSDLLTVILFLLVSGISWHMLPQELGCGYGMTCWRRLRAWQLAGVWDLIHFALLD